MNSTWFAQNKVLAAFLALVLIGAIGLGYLAFQSGTRNAEVSERYDRQVAELQRLSALPLYPSKENQQLLMEQQQEYQAELHQLHAALSSIEKAVEPTSPAEFKSRLTRERDQFRQKAQEAGVEIPENFFLGFEDYEASLPPDDATATLLARQLGAIESVLSALVDTKVLSIKGVRRTPLPGEATAAKPSAPPSGSQTKQDGPVEPLIVRYPFTVAFQADQTRVREALNAIPKLPYAFIVRVLNIDNNVKSGPSRTAPTLPPLAGADGEPPIQFILGNEDLIATLQIELAVFNPLNPEPQSSP